MNIKEKLLEETDRFTAEIETLRFGPKAAMVYNPLVYASQPYKNYLSAYGNGRKKVLFLGMNPGPWGMAQTGIPFGEINSVREWLKVDGSIEKPEKQHPKRPVTGWETKRSEVSGRRLWGLFREKFKTPENFFKDHFVENYCPLVFMEESGRNLTPDKLPAEEKAPLFKLCDIHIKRIADILSPEYIIGIGKFAEKRLKEIFSGSSIIIASILHPSPANPKANRDWAGAASEELKRLNIWN